MYLMCVWCVYDLYVMCVIGCVCVCACVCVCVCVGVCLGFCVCVCVCVGVGVLGVLVNKENNCTLKRRLFFVYWLGAHPKDWHAFALSHLQQQCVYGCIVCVCVCLGVLGVCVLGVCMCGCVCVCGWVYWLASLLPNMLRPIWSGW